MLMHLLHRPNTASFRGFREITLAFCRCDELPKTKGLQARKVYLILVASGQLNITARSIRLGKAACYGGEEERSAFEELVPHFEEYVPPVTQLLPTRPCLLKVSLPSNRVIT